MIRGEQFGASIAALEGVRRDEAIMQAMDGGNVPPFLLAFVPVETTATIRGRVRTCRLEVSPDVLGIGATAGDYLRTPLDGAHAELAAARYDCVLPTPRISDAIWSVASVRLAPRPLTSAREATATIITHNEIVRTQLGGAAGALVAGHKKDIVQPHNPGRVAIYGWHDLNTGKPIQGFSNIHGAGYADYSHGVRLVRRRVHVDGSPMVLDDVLNDPELAALVSGQGAALAGVAYAAASQRDSSSKRPMSAAAGGAVDRPIGAGTAIACGGGLALAAVLMARHVRRRRETPLR